MRYHSLMVGSEAVFDSLLNATRTPIKARMIATEYTLTIMRSHTILRSCRTSYDIYRTLASCVVAS